MHFTKDLVFFMQKSAMRVKPLFPEKETDNKGNTFYKKWGKIRVQVANCNQPASKAEQQTVDWDNGIIIDLSIKEASTLVSKLELPIFFGKWPSNNAQLCFFTHDTLGDKSMVKTVSVTYSAPIKDGGLHGVFFYASHKDSNGEKKVRAYVDEENLRMLSLGIKSIWKDLIGWNNVENLN